MDFLKTVIIEIDDEFELKIFRFKDAICYLRIRNGSGKFRIYERTENPKENKIKKISKNNLKFKVYKKFMQSMKIDITILYRKKISFKNCDKILIKIISYINKRNQIMKTGVNANDNGKRLFNYNSYNLYRILKHVTFL
jgi:hypothetical protein